MEKKSLEKRCCQGYGFWPIGLLTSIGILDSGMWKGKIIRCPVCKAGDIEEGERYERLLKHFKKIGLIR